MPYISTDEVKVKRNLIKKAFPTKDGWKISVRGRNHSTISVTIKAAPFQMLDKDNKYEQVNHFWIEDHYQDNPKTKKALLKLYDIMNTNNGTLVVDGDYGAVPNFYTAITIGDWDCPFIITPKKKK